jgi:quercetin dioxygenase-like cupin family protein
MKAATIEPVKHGLMAAFDDEEFPCRAYGINTDMEALEIQGPGTVFGYLHEGQTWVMVDGHFDRVLFANSYFSIPQVNRSKMLASEGSKGFVAFRNGYLGLNIVGRFLEERGRLKYIDGCSDTLLIAPPLKGDPCFNLLHFPTGISQTKHTHPTVRIGLVHAGSGWCHTADGTEELATGSMFILAPDAIHAFETTEHSMQLTVFHPDSDYGPTHEEHPMLNRTIVGGVSAKNIDDIRTKTIR